MDSQGRESGSLCPLALGLAQALPQVSTLTAKVIALLQREVPIFTGVAGITSYVGFAAAVAVLL